jgi:hypothetical protein
LVSGNSLRFMFSNVKENIYITSTNQI